MRILLLLTVLLSPVTLAQDFWTAGELDDLGASLKEQVGSNNAAVLDRIIDEGRYFAAMVHREPGPGFSESHADWADLYFVTSGSAAIITGGTLVNAREESPGEMRGTAIQGGTRHTISEGDVVHIPAGVAHHVLVEAGHEISYFIFKAQSH